jgi:hypothetical protein
VTVAREIVAAHCGHLLDHHAHDYLGRDGDPCRCSGTMRGQRTFIYIRGHSRPTAALSQRARLARVATRWGEEI